MKSFPILAVLLATAISSLAASPFNVKSFGAKGDGFTLDTLALQKAVDAARAVGGGVVLIPQGQFMIDPITLASGVNLHLEPGAVILLENKISRYPVLHNRYADGITATGCHNVEITGSGTIDGLGEVWWQSFRSNPHMIHRPYLIKFQNCTNDLGPAFGRITPCHGPTSEQFLFRDPQACIVT